MYDRLFREKIVLVGVTLPSGSPEETDAALDELTALVDTAGADAVSRIVQRRDTPDATTFIGKGKATEVRSESDLHDAVYNRYIFGELVVRVD